MQHRGRREDVEKAVGSVALQAPGKGELLGLGNREREPNRCGVHVMGTQRLELRG